MTANNYKLGANNCKLGAKPGVNSEFLGRQENNLGVILLFELGSRVINNNDSNKTPESSCHRLQLQ